MRLTQWILVAYYTKDTGYEEEIKGLIDSASPFDIKMHVEEVENKGSWQLNTLEKAHFILKMLETYPNSSIVYVDADARVRQKPEIFDDMEGYDLGLCYRDYELFPIHSRREGRELLSGTIYFANNIDTTGLVLEWIKENERHPGLWEQINLQNVLNGHGNLKILELPPTYCQIFDFMAKAGKPVIEQMQASRKYRRLIQL